MSELEKRYFTETEVCVMFGITRKTLLQWRKTKQIGYIKTPTGLIRYRPSHIEEWERRNGREPRKVRRVA